MILLGISVHQRSLYRVYINDGKNMLTSPSTCCNGDGQLIAEKVNGNTDTQLMKQVNLDEQQGDRGDTK